MKKNNKPHIKYKKLNWSYIHFAFLRQHFLKQLLSLTKKSNFYFIIIYYCVYIENFYNMFWIQFVFLNVCSLYFCELCHRLIRHIASISRPIPITCHSFVYLTTCCRAGRARSFMQHSFTENGLLLFLLYKENLWGAPERAPVFKSVFVCTAAF